MIFRRRLLLGSIALSLLVACGGEKASTPTATPATATAAAGRVEGTATPRAATATGGTPNAATRTATTATSPTAGGAQPGGSDPCRLLTKDEVQASVGFTLGNGSLQRTPLGETCFYSEQSSRLPATGNASVTVVRGASARTLYDAARSELRSGTEVPGLGDRAFLAVGEIQSNVLVMKGDTLLMIDVVHGSPRPSDADIREKLIALARTGIGRL